MKSYKNNTINLKYQVQHEMMNLNYLMGYTQIADTQDYFKTCIKKTRSTDNPLIQTYADNKFNNIVTAVTKTEYILELSTPETKKLFEINEKSINKNSIM